MQNADTVPSDKLVQPPGMEEASIPFDYSERRPIARRRSRPARPVGVRLHRAGTPALAIPDIAALPRALRDDRVKRGLDLTLACALLLLLALPMAVIALLLMPGGGAIFAQPRVGRAGARFACFKFRTMRPGSEALLLSLLASDSSAAREWRAHQKLRRDPRVTALGRFLRRSSLDELPQLFNVLRGEMSLVGPRPIVAPEIDGYPGDRAYYRAPCFVDYAGCLPGLTGLWQVSGRSDTDHDARVELDRLYARNWSVLLDLAILWRTVGVVLSGSGR